MTDERRAIAIHFRHASRGADATLEYPDTERVPVATGHLLIENHDRYARDLTKAQEKVVGIRGAETRNGRDQVR